MLAACVVFLADPVPAQARPLPVPVRAEAAQRDESSLTGSGLTLDMAKALDLAASGVTVTAVGGATRAEAGVTLPVGRGSKITYAAKITGGKILLHGGIQLAKGNRKVAISKLGVDIRTGSITATVGDRAGMRIGTVAEPGSAEAAKTDGKTTVTLKLAQHGIGLDAALFAALDAALGTSIADQVETVDGSIDASLDVDVDLADEGKPNAALITALGLDSNIGGGPSALADAVFDVDISLGG